MIYHIIWAYMMKLNWFLFFYDFIYIKYVVYSLVNLYVCKMLVILRNISIKIHFAACFELKHIKVCFHFLNFPLIKFHLRGFHLLQKFSLAHHLQMHTRHNSYNDGDKKVCQVKQVFMGMHEYNFFVSSLLMLFGRLPDPSRY